MQRPELRVRDPPGAAWKSHISRQLRHRDRSQHGGFQELVRSYRKLLERSSFLKDLTETIQTESSVGPGIHHGVRGSGLDDLPALQKEIEELRRANGKLAVEAYELKKQIEEKNQQVQEQNDRMGVMLMLVEEHKQQRQNLENEVALMVCTNADVKDDYDRLLAQRLLLENSLQDAEVEQREHLETMTRKKALEAEQVNNFNARRKEETWTSLVRKALRKSVSAEGDVRHKARADTYDCGSLSLSESLEDENPPPPRKNRSQSMMVLSSSRVMGAIKSLFDFNLRKEEAGYSTGGEWYHPTSVCVLSSVPRRALYSEEIHDSEIHAVRFSPNSNMLATGGADRVVKIWEISGGRLHSQQILDGSNGGITSIEFDHSGVRVLAASFDGSAHLWRLGNKSSESLTGHKGKVTAARFKMSSYGAVTCSMDRTVREWDLNKGACVRCIPVSSYCSDVVCLDSYMISGHHDKKIRFWDSRSDVCIRELALEEKITSLCVDQDQTQLLSCSRDDTLRLIDLRRVTTRQEFRDDGFKCGCDWTKAILSPDGGYSIVGSADGTIFIWNARTGVLERSLTGEHSTSVNAVAWSISGHYVVSVDRGRKAVLWSEY